ncbi:Uncharacterized protein dnm_040350 [Desulfonema magnum]|uniref:Uncharacterized protein n=1 Tax=Desulfonema magnum TaxID=45655 RepID=A0A975BM49_9BACT|nr:Uncharacterized protein dnm_040350 [Desulfonema magnum]
MRWVTLRFTHPTPDVLFLGKCLKDNSINGHELPVTTNDESFTVFPDT